MSSPTTRFAPLLAIAALLSCNDDSTPTQPAGAATEFATTAATTALAFEQVSAGGSHTCGVTTDSRLYCWGWNYNGQLGDGTTTSRPRPVAVGGALRFRLVSAGGGSTCGITTDYRLYCWGWNLRGQLGDGTTVDRLTPVAIATGKQFRWVDGGSLHTCGVSYPDNRAYCWGGNASGQLGDETTTQRLVPTAVAGTLRFRHLSAGWEHTCGVTTEDRAFCWGSNQRGQIGDSSTAAQRVQPTPVKTTRRFRQLDVGSYHTCAVSAADNRAFCWGDGRVGQLGNGKSYLSFWPRAVAGGLTFERLSAFSHFTCGETPGNRAYCWGYNYSGMLGDGTTTTRLTPVAVGGGLYFRQVSAGGSHACGKTPASEAYCWGGNDTGELGDGTTTSRLLPTPVVGPM